MDPIMELATTLVEAVSENPFAAAFLASLARNVTGYLQNKLKLGSRYNKSQIATTLLKFEVAIPALSVFLPVEYAAAGVVLADILGSWARKLV